ncbi:MAG: gfo/Idh/MocA family oxidoreductase, partial [Bacteroidales bacterium]|nr:gfo/Idh/MocA family oxidoreductase [Bacteroidales bacterium]
DPLQQAAGVRDGALACLVGIAARKSIASREPVMIKDLTTIQPLETKAYKKLM